MKAKTCIFILGMHRSGTSALGGVLERLGVSMGQIQLQPHECNPKGFYENEKIVRFHDDRLFPAIDSYWDDLMLLPDRWEESRLLDGLYGEAKKIIDEESKFLNIIGIKDPRMCILFPFWEKVLSTLSIEIKVVLPFRNPLEVAHSLQKRDGFSIEKSLLLWAKHVLFAEYNSRDYVRVFTDYEQLLDNPKSAIENIQTALSIDFPKKYDEMSVSIADFLEKDLKSHRLALSNLSSNLPGFVIDVANTYYGLSVGKVKYDELLRKKFDFWRCELRKYYELFHNQDIRNSIEIAKKTVVELSNLKNIYEPTLSIQLFTDTGHGYSEETSIKIHIAKNSETQEFIFDLSDKQPLHTIRLDPLNDSCVMEVQELKIVSDSGEVDIVGYIGANVCAHHGKSYFFETADPQMYFADLPQDILSGAKKLVAKIRYIHIGRDALHVCANQIMTDKNYQAQQQTQTIEQQTQIIEQQTQTIEQQTQTIELQSQTIEQQTQTIELQSQTMSELVAKNISLENEVIKYAMSRSWRITRPLRALMRILGAR